MLKQKSENVDNFTHLNLQADSSRETNQYTNCISKFSIRKYFSN